MKSNPRTHRILLAIGAIILIILLLLWNLEEAEARPLPSSEDTEEPQPEFSTAGFYLLRQDSPRTAESLNPAWRFAKGTHPDAWQQEYAADSTWTTVSLPHGLELLPVEASGGINYRGEAWYRKYFQVPDHSPDARYIVYFEAIMGKSKVWVNGRLVSEHYGGFLPVIADIGGALHKEPDAVNVIAVMTDNSDDTLYPPGKAQDQLDYCYFGGIYRDVWLVSTGHVYLTDPNQAGIPAAGGVYIWTQKLKENEATLMCRYSLANDTPEAVSGRIEFTCETHSFSFPYTIEPHSMLNSEAELKIPSPRLWSPDEPTLYELEVRVKDEADRILDGYRQKIGIRTIEFAGRKGFFLNGKPYGRKLIGANRHQDYAVVGNALSNSLHWRDAVKLKEAGMDIVRNAHYPQDPAFMDACDLLGLFVIVNTPGWQFWNDEPVFGERVYDDIRQMVRRDRSRPSVLMWEPVLNETWYPEEFAKKVHDLVHEEAPTPNTYTASDSEARGNEHFDVQFAHPSTGDREWAAEHIHYDKVYFTREWGDNVDDWSSHNSTSRVARQWGEVPQLVQAWHYARGGMNLPPRSRHETPEYPVTSYEALWHAPPHHIGGTLWHAFDHQRGYHPDPFYGGIMDAFRRPKYSYYMFRSQSDRVAPTVHIAHDLNPFSPKDVTIFTNCETTRVRSYVAGKEVLDKVYFQLKEPLTMGALPAQHLPHPPVTVAGAWEFMADKALSRSGRQKEAYILAEGIRDGEVVVSHRRSMARRPTALRLELDTENIPPVADGSDLVTVVAQLVDANGEIKRLNNQSVRFTVEGEGRLLIPGSQSAGVPVLWGEAPVLLQTTTTPGVVRIRAEIAGPQGDWTPEAAVIQFRTLPSPNRLNYLPQEAARIGRETASAAVPSGDTATNRTDREQRLREVEAQQEAFGE